MCNMQVLWLSDNKIGDHSLAALAGALGKGALPNCTTIIDAYGSPASAEAMQAVKDSIASRA